MKKRALLLVSVGLVGCQVDQVVSIDAPVAQAVSWAQKVTGGGHFARPFSTGTFQVSAHSGAGGVDPRGNAAITADQDAPFLDFDVQGPVTCLAVGGNRAAVGIKVAKGTWGGADVTGQGIVLTLEDNGSPGKGVPDGVTNSGFYPDGDAIPCQLHLGDGTFANPSGNVVIDSR